MIWIVVPVFNEKDALPGFLARAASWLDSGTAAGKICARLIFSDGGSSDGSLDILRASGHRVVTGAQGRGAQCQAAFEEVCRLGAAAGDIIFFVHVDSVLEPGALRALDEACSRGVLWGCLSLRFDLPGPAYAFGALMSNLRVRCTGIAFGDQGIFATRAALEKAGGVPPLPLMEDYELSRRLRAYAWPVQLLCKIWTSARRFEEGGRLRTALQMRHLRALYRRGADVGTLAAQYRNVRGGAKAQGPDGKAADSLEHARPLDRQGSFILMTRIPVPGEVKTRLLPVLTPEQCAELQRAMALDAAASLSQTGARLRVAYSTGRTEEAASINAAAKDGLSIQAVQEEPQAAQAYPQASQTAQASQIQEQLLQELASKLSIADAAPGEQETPQLYPQEGADLGERMHHALVHELAQGAPVALLMGSDLPQVGASELKDIYGGFLGSSCDVLLCPTQDGGYWLVGLRTSFPELFSGKTYGSGSVFKEAQATCARHGRSVMLGPVKADVDTPEDLRQLIRELDAGPAQLGQPGQPARSGQLGQHTKAVLRGLKLKPGLKPGPERQPGPQTDQDC